MEAKESTKKEKVVIYSLLLATLAILVIAAVIVLGKTVEYAPLTVVDIKPEPLQSCPGDEIRVNYVYRYNGGLYTMDSVRGDTFFVGAPDDSGEEPRPVGGNHYYDDFENRWVLEDKEDFERPGPTRREAPFAGTWYPAVDATISGRLFGVIPVSQEIVYTDDTSVEVREYSNPECVAERLAVAVENAENLQEELRRLAEQESSDE